MNCFPESLKLLKDGYSANLKPPMLRSEVESGPVLQRALSTAGYETRQVTYLVEGADALAEVREWLKTIGNGSLSFWWPDPEKLALGLSPDESLIEARIINGEISLSPVTKRFSAWHLTMTLEPMNT